MRYRKASHWTKCWWNREIPSPRATCSPHWTPIALRTAIWDAQDELDSLTAQLQEAKGESESQYITTAVSGRIKQVFAEEGADVDDVMAEHGALMILSIDGKMRVSFTPSTTEGLQAGDEVIVTLSDGDEEDGEIASITQQECVVTLTDRGPDVGEQVSVTLDDGTAFGSGTLAINKPVAITGVSGVIDEIRKDEGTYVSKNTKLIEMKEASITREYDALYEDVQEQTDVVNTLLAYTENNAILAPCGGVISTVSVSDGETLGNSGASSDSTSSDTESSTGSASSLGGMTTGSSNSSSSGSSSNSDTSTGAQETVTAFSIKTGSTMELVVSIDELDILSVAVGQTAKITLDAIPDLTLEGTITDIDAEGTVSQGVASYSTTLELTANESMRVGMNATATIIIERKENVVVIPLAALQEMGDEQFVYIASASNTDEIGERRAVTTGLSNGENVEITDGLTAGEKINYVYTAGNEEDQITMPFGGGFDRRNQQNDQTDGNGGNFNDGSGNGGSMPNDPGQRP